MSVRTATAWAVAALALSTVPALPAQAASHHRAPAARTITYAGQGIRVHDLRDVARLRGSSDRFRDFVLREGARQRTEAQKGCDVSLVVKSYRTDGYAVGSMWARGCGGAQAVWATRHGVWGLVWAGQYQPTCRELSARAGRTVPKGLAGCR